MVKRNANFATLQKSYLFVEIEKRKDKFREEHPDAKLISLGIGDTSEPITPVICNALCDEAKGRYSAVEYMPCQPENNFFPDLDKQKRTDIIYFCSPNNPTGSVATREQLEQLVRFAKKNKSIIIFDSAYREYIKDPALPKSIFEIEGAREVAMETCSFSKLIGYTGVRLGWTVVPKEVKFEDGGSLYEDWARIAGTLFNGPSNIASAGGVAALSPSGMKEMQETVDYYMANA
eukprot:Selendium_serpulae@DN5051_c0_g1_i23.p1